MEQGAARGSFPLSRGCLHSGHLQWPLRTGHFLPVCGRLSCFLGKGAGLLRNRLPLLSLTL